MFKVFTWSNSQILAFLVTITATGCQLPPANEDYYIKIGVNDHEPHFGGKGGGINSSLLSNGWL